MSDQDKQALLDEIVAFSTTPPMLPTDITLEDVMNRMGKSKNTAQSRMKALEATGAWQKVFVWDPELGTRRRVWRKVK